MATRARSGTRKRGAKRPPSHSGTHQPGRPNWSGKSVKLFAKGLYVGIKDCMLTAETSIHAFAVNALTSEVLCSNFIDSCMDPTLSKHGRQISKLLTIVFVACMLAIGWFQGSFSLVCFLCSLS